MKITKNCSQVKPTPGQDSKTKSGAGILIGQTRRLVNLQFAELEGYGKIRLQAYPRTRKLYVSEKI
jgi:hypothetical protein